ncbi:MAG: hypothetical protein A2Z14_12145 [Chloroflexi bacterium RBG_16_48_8]|nr:MAG: hypothetical protein A2Z14_12145 [Chloroflexi bacterium RBG_16_48_8]
MIKKTTCPSPRLTGHTNLNDHDDYWECYGPEAGPSVVLLHHGLGSIRSWKRQIPTLVEQGYNVVVYDRWGYGRSDPRPAFEAHFLHHEAEEAESLLRTLGVEQTSLIGHSDGGTIAIILAARHPKLIRNLILIAAHIYVEPKMVTGLRLIRMASQEPPFSTALEREHGSRAKTLVQSWLDCWIEHGSQTLDLIKELASVICPTFVVQGERDEHATPQHAKDIAKGIREAFLWLIPEVGHMPPQEIADEFNHRMIQFLQENLTPSTSLKATGSERENV